MATNAIKKGSNWLLIIGIVMVVLGIIGLSMQIALTITSLIFFGFLTVFAGVVQFVQIFSDEGTHNKIWDILLALVYIVAGFMMIQYPAASAAWFTIVIAFVLVIAGIARLLIASRMKNNNVQGWGLVIFGGLISILLGGMIFASWPVSGLWVIGMFIAIELLMQGFTLILAALAVRSLN